jgi:uncharacterized protein (TIGR02118 family)
VDARLKERRMVKIVFCLRRLQTLTPEEFHRYWLQKHGPLVRSHASALRIRRYTQGHTFFDRRTEAAVDARGCQVRPYDGVAELYWDSMEDLVEAAGTPGGRAAGRELLADERRFIDLPNCAMFYVHEHEIVAV